MDVDRDPAHLLVVDDDSLLRGMAARTLRHGRFEVGEAASGEAALERFAERSYDLVLLDVMMPGLDGYETCQRIRAMPQGSRVPILILTGLNDTESIDLAYRHGATDFITKPINWTLLTHRVRYALRASRAAEAVTRSREGLARAQSLAAMGNWALFPDGRMEGSVELLRLFGASAEADQHDSAEAFLERIVAADRDDVRTARARLERDGTPYKLEYRIGLADGAVRTVFEQAARGQGDRVNIPVMEGFTQDISERVQARERIRQLAYYDEITGLPNRQFFAELVGPMLERADRNHTSCAVLHLDVDRFTGVNDAFGRTRGDAVLKTVADRLRLWIRASDLATVHRTPAEQGMLARVGGNAFTLLITDLAGQEHAAVVAERLLAVIAQPILVGARSLVLSASIGVAIYPNDASGFAGLARCAEQALHAAKSAGRAQHRFFDEEMNARAADRLVLETELRRGLDEGELQLHFQAKVDAASGAIVGAEALVRWQHPSRGLVLPGEFIPLAEETGLIALVTDRILELACGYLRAWSDAQLLDIPLSVNLAASNLDTALPGKLATLMHRFGLSPSRLTLEITETMLMSDVEAGVLLLDSLRASGYGLSLDDFGTGYSSLSHLKRFPIDELKMDRAFITNAAQGGRDGALAMVIIALGRELGLKVVAEGVETLEQSRFLLAKGCNVQQGYFFSRPVPPEAFERLLRAGAIFPAASAAAPPCEPATIVVA